MSARIVRMLLGLIMSTAVITAIGLGGSGVNQAQAAEMYPKAGQRSAQVNELQRRLVKAKALKSSSVTGYYGTQTTAGVKKFQKKSKLSQTGKVNATTWKALVKKTGSVTVKGIDKRCKVTGRVLCVDKTRDKLYYLKNSQVIATLDARFGCSNMRTREGRYSVYRKSRNHVSSIYHTPMPFAMFFSGGQAVHYSADFAARGYKGCSHGCVNIRDRSGIAWLFDQIRVGDRVVVYKS